mgnify:FL=1
MVWPRRRVERRSVVDEASVLEAPVWGYSDHLRRKGVAGSGPRSHQIPLVELARADLSLLKRDGEVAISTIAGQKAISVRTLAGWAHAIVGGTIEGFQLKRIRSGVETLLAASGVSRDVRGRLQSHGLTGVQARHYDGHDYMPEKRQAIEILIREVCQRAPAHA